jgi:hypothetical protein
MIVQMKNIKHNLVGQKGSKYIGSDRVNDPGGNPQFCDSTLEPAFSARDY